MNFQDDIPSIPVDKFKHHNAIAFDWTSTHDATENSSYTELVGEPMRLELNFTFDLEHITERIVLEEQSFLVAVDNLGVVGKKI